MRPSFRTRAGITSAVVLGIAAALLSPLTPASGDISTLCTGYRGCNEEGKDSGGYAKHNHRSYWQMYSGHNCTNYVAYRLVRKGMRNRRPWDGAGDATHWGRQLREWTDLRPAVGSVAWWKAGTRRGGRTGHVAYVERVVSPSEVVVSQDSWGGDFSWARVTRSRGWPTGFIHLRDTPLKPLGAPTVSGTVRVGQRLTATRASWDPRPTSVSYRWLVGGRTVPGADTRSLLLTRDMLGRRIQVRAVARRLGHPRSVVTSRATGPTRPGLFTLTRPPGLTGRATVMRTLSVAPGSWSPRPRRVGYRWFADGEPLRRARSSRLDLRPGLADARIAVQVTVRRPGYEPATRTLRARDRVAPARLRVAAAPRLTGIPRGGQTLRVRAGRTEPRAELAGVRWLRDGAPVRGASGAGYRLGRDDLGHRIRAQVRYRREGYETLTLLTTPTRRIRTTPRVSVDADRGRRGVRLEVAATAAGQPLRTDVVVTRRGRLVARDQLRRGSAVMRIRGLRPGRRTLHVLVRATPTTERLVVVKKVRIRR